MSYYLFELHLMNDEDIKIYRSIDSANDEYIKYNRFLTKEYFITIEENDDFIPMTTENKSSLTLRSDQFEENGIEDIFELLHNVIITRNDF